jgi:iron complex transport system substrate-binding protein
MLCALVAAASLPALATAGAAPAPPAGRKPQRVMTMMVCADQYAMLMLPPSRISSITYVSREGSLTPALDAEAARLPVNHGLAEEVLAQKPDLIVAGTFTTPATRRLVKEMHIPLIELDAAYSFADIRRQTRMLGEAFGEPARAEALIARMDAALEALRRTAPRRKIVAVAWSAGGRVPAKRSVFNSILEAAGGINAAAGADVFVRQLDLEQLLSVRPQPDGLLNAVSGGREAGAQAELVAHPVLDHAYKGRRATYPTGAYRCGSPLAADEAAALRKDLLAVMAKPRRAR